MKPEQILKALADVGSSYASVGRNLSPPVVRQSVRDAVLLIKPSTRIMEAVAETIGRLPAEVFPEKAHLFDQNHTGKASHRSTSNAQASLPGNPSGHSGGRQNLPLDKKLKHASDTGCNVNVRGGN